MFRTSSRPLWQLAARASPNRASLPRASIAPLLRQQRAVYSSKSDQENPPPPKQPIDYEAERKRGQELLQSDPGHVSSKSSTANTTGIRGPPKGDESMGNELKHDINIVKDTFTFTNVPRESRILGLAGTLPYLGTSLSTVFLAWNLNKDLPTGNSFYDTIMVDHETAKYLLSVIEPLQLGYGAVIISFLGAIHWGLEYAEKSPSLKRTRFRYGMGLASSVIAWPTLMLPVEYALTTQFMAFVGLYFADSRAATKGWAPRWYGSYRFLLTAMVGFAIFISLIGRAKIKQGDAITAKGLSNNFARSGIADHDTNWEKLEEEEKERQRKKKAEEEKKAKEAEKKKKEEEKKKGKKGGDKQKKSDDKAKASEEGKDKKGEEKDEGKKSESESKDDGKKSESKDGDNKAESKDEGKEEKPKDEESKEESSDKQKDESENKDSEEESDKKDDKSEEKKDDKSEDKKDDSKDKDDSQDKKDDSKDKKDDSKDKKDDSKDKKDDSKKKDDKE
ncbi:putative mnn4-regulates the mannosylphosphorylation [Fusarium sporotrichioides]|uniref:Putative mnn4-regulates the mannosylphosphorylation n=1 Tax=Fusarium sporotrichioides TaxID=5514 RepID=A0A395RIU0_FUSSP|nr:putative mnn4-regulates the mannosylphosphorylation [Fusarium sporotrichioides]